MCTPDRIRAHSRQTGLTIIELIMFIVIVSVGVAGILLVFNVTTRSSADPQLRKQALAIAEALMDEVQGARFTFCDPLDPAADNPQTQSVANCAIVENVGQESNNQRPFDNVNDYVSAFGTPVVYSQDATGQNLPSGYTASVTITPEPLNGIASDATPANMNVLRIRVTVDFRGDQIVLDGYRTRYAPRWIP